MSTHETKQRILRIVTIAIFLLTGCAENRSQPGVKDHGKMKPDANTVDDLRNLWSERYSTFDPQSKSTPWAKITLLSDAIKSLPRSEYALIATHLTHVLGQPEPSEFDRYLCQAFVVVLVDRAEREELVNALATACPRVISTQDVELYITIAAPPDLEDPILVFVDAFRQSDSSDVRDELVMAMRRAFRGHVDSEYEDDVFVDNCASWYSRNKAQLSIDDEYAFNRDLHRGNEVALFKIDGHGEPEK